MQVMTLKKLNDLKFSLGYLHFIIKVQTCEKLERPQCGFFPAAQIFHSDIYTTLMKVQTCEGWRKGGAYSL